MSFVNSVSATKTNQVMSKMETTSSGVSIQGALDATAIGNNLIDIVYPIGFIITTFTNTNPSTLLANTTWVRFGEGKCVVGVSDTDVDFAEGATGGVKEVVLTEAQMPSHTHTYIDTIRQVGFSVGGQGAYHASGSFASNTRITNPTGSTQAHPNMPPYISCYMWRRTA